MGVNSLPKTVTQQRHGCDLNPGPTAPESSTLTTRLPSHPNKHTGIKHSAMDETSCLTTSVVKQASNTWLVNLAHVPNCQQECLQQQSV